MNTRTILQLKRTFGTSTDLEIRFSRYAERDLDDLSDRIKQHRPAVAAGVITRILQSIGYLRDFPRLGRPGLLPDTRELSIYGLPYKAVYRIEGDIIFVLGIVHTSRQYPGA